MLDDGWRVLGNGVLGNGVLGLVFEDKRFGDERLEMSGWRWWLGDGGWEMMVGR